MKNIKPIFRLLLIFVVICLLTLLINHCKKDSNSSSSEATQINWSFGKIATYTITPTNTVHDSISGNDFTLNNLAASTTLNVSKILAGAPAPFEGSGYKIEYTGNDELYVKIKCTKDEKVLGMMYAYPDGLFNGIITQSWIGIPVIKYSTDSTEVIFSLPQPYEYTPMKKGGTPAGKKLKGANLFWFSKISKLSSTCAKMYAIEKQVATFMSDYINKLNPTMKASVTSAYKANPLHFAYGSQTFYEPYWRPLGALSAYNFYPTICLELSAGRPADSDIAHETAHYFINLLVGDAVQRSLCNQGSIFDNHGMNEVPGRNYVVDEYVYFTTSIYANYDAAKLEEPAFTFSGHIPMTTDYPSIEGFGGTMLYSLVRSKSTIQNVYNRKTNLDYPVIGLTFGQVFDIIAQGALDNNTLRTNIANYLVANGTKAQFARFQIDLQRIGWSYDIKGILVDSATNTPLVGYYVQNLIKGEPGVEYTNGDGATFNSTDSKGIFWLFGTVIPGESILRFTKNNKSADVTINCNYINPTNKTIDLSTIKIKADLTPYIKSVVPASGKAGDQITITGSNFGADKSKGHVLIGTGLAALTDIVTWSDTQIKMKIPAAATTGNLYVSNNGTSNPFPFTVSASTPVISSISPTQGKIGDQITINGSFFGTSGYVSFNGLNTTSLDILAWANTQIKVKVPVGATTGNVKVVSTGLSSNGILFTVNSTAPSISSISPSSGASGTSILISGSNFGSTGTVSFNGINALSSDISSWSNTQISLKVPAGATTGPVKVTTGGIQSNSVTFTVGTSTAPTISSISPSQGIVADQVTISGTNLGITGTVSFNGTNAVSSDIISWSNTKIIVKVPFGATSGTIYITANSVQSNGAQFTVNSSSPVITSITPNPIPVGSVVTINGSGFGNYIGTDNTIECGFSDINYQMAIPVTSWTDSKIVFSLPSGFSCNGKNGVGAGYIKAMLIGVKASNKFSVTFGISKPPVITSISPANPSSNSLITITGYNFGDTPGTASAWCDQTPVSWSNTSITFIEKCYIKTGLKINIHVDAPDVNNYPGLGGTCTTPSNNFQVIWQ